METRTLEQKTNKNIVSIRPRGKSLQMSADVNTINQGDEEGQHDYLCKQPKEEITLGLTVLKGKIREYWLLTICKLL